jgi:1-acyl-sn-glycerol-3-phosphate acyltransferase
LLLVVITLLWLSLGFVLPVLCIAAGILPMSWGYFLITSLGMQVMIKGRPSAGPLQLILDKNNNKLAAVAGVLFICSHRTLLDPIFFSVALGCCITAVTYSISQFSEIVSPIKTVALNTQQRARCYQHSQASGRRRFRNLSGRDHSL